MIIIIYGEYKTPDSYVNAFVMKDVLLYSFLHSSKQYRIIYDEFKGITNMQMVRHIYKLNFYP